MEINFVKRAYWASLALYQKKSIEADIAKFDRSVNTRGFPGWRFFDRMITPVELPRPSDFDSSGISMTRNISTPVGELAAHVIKELSPEIKNYLGPDARLDDLVLFWFDPATAKAEKSVSGSWHNDNVGHRLKLYLCLKGNGSTPTIVMPDTHKRRYSFRLKELGRFLGIADTRPRQGEVRLSYKTGDVAIFDTNAEHRGAYEQPSSERVVVVAEFINRNKSNTISGKAPCGPGSSIDGEVLFSTQAYAALLQTGLIDEKISQEKPDVVSYSIAHAKAA